MLKNLSEIKNVNFEQINSEDQFKEILQISEQEWQEIMKWSQSSTDENTPEGLEDIRIQIDVIDENGEEDVLSMDLVYSIKNETVTDEGCRDFELDALNHVIVYY